MESTVANTPRMDFYGNKAFLMGLSVCCGKKAKSLLSVCSPENMWSSTSQGIIWAKTLMLGKTEGRRRRGRQRTRWLEASLTKWTWVWASSGSWWWTGKPGVLWFMGLQSRTQLSNWTELIWANVVARVWDLGELEGGGGILCPFYNLKSKTPIPRKYACLKTWPEDFSHFSLRIWGWRLACVSLGDVLFLAEAYSECPSFYYLTGIGFPWICTSKNFFLWCS